MQVKSKNTSEEKKENITQHKKSADISSAKSKKQDPKKNIEKTGGKHDDWNDPTGNSHISTGKK